MLRSDTIFNCHMKISLQSFNTGEYHREKYAFLSCSFDFSVKKQSL